MERQFGGLDAGRKMKKGRKEERKKNGEGWRERRSGGSVGDSERGGATSAVFLGRARRARKVEPPAALTGVNRRPLACFLLRLFGHRDGRAVFEIVKMGVGVARRIGGFRDRGVGKEDGKRRPVNEPVEMAEHSGDRLQNGKRDVTADQGSDLCVSVQVCRAQIARI